MLKSTNLFQADLVRHFARRFGDLLSRFEPRESVFGASRRLVFDVPEVATAHS